MKYYLKRNRHRILKLFLAVTFILGCLAALRYFLNTTGEVVSTDDSSATEGFSTDRIVSLDSRTLNFGSLSWAQGAGGPEPLKSPFGSLEAFKRSDYDAWIGNLDCPISSEKSALICMDAQVLDFAKWFNVVALGGLLQGNGQNDLSTTSSLVKNNIQFFGHTTSIKNPEDCEVVSLPARFKLKDNSYQQASMPIVMCAVNGEKTLDVDVVADIKRYAEVLPVWVYALDSGNASSSQRQDQYRSYIDAGADLVMGVTSPKLGTTEVYEGRLIAYSLGHFLGPVEDGIVLKGSALLSVDIAADRDEIIEWEKIAKTCTGYEDLCVEAAKSQMLKKPKYIYDYSIIAVNLSNIQNPIPADATLTADVLSALNWFDTEDQLKSVQ